MGLLIKSRTAMLTKATCMLPNLAWHQPKVDFRKAKVTLYWNKHKFGLNRPWLERAVCWKGQAVHVSDMLIICRNEVSRALPVLALKSNYLDHWLNDIVPMVSFGSQGFTMFPEMKIHVTKPRPPLVSPTLKFLWLKIWNTHARTTTRAHTNQN